MSLKNPLLKMVSSMMINKNNNLESIDKEITLLNQKLIKAKLVGAPGNIRILEEEIREMMFFSEKENRSNQHLWIKEPVWDYQSGRYENRWPTYLFDFEGQYNNPCLVKKLGSPLLTIVGLGKALVKIDIRSYEGIVPDFILDKVIEEQNNFNVFQVMTILNSKDIIERVCLSTPLRFPLQVRNGELSKLAPVLYKDPILLGRKKDSTSPYSAVLGMWGEDLNEIETALLKGE